MSKESNIDWKAYAIMGGIALGVYVLARVAETYAVEPLLSEAKTNKKKDKEESEPEED